MLILVFMLTACWGSEKEEKEPTTETTTETEAPAATPDSASNYSSGASDVGENISTTLADYIDTNDRITAALIDLQDYPSIEAGQGFMNTVSSETLPDLQNYYNEMRAIQKQAESLTPLPELQSSHGLLLKAIDRFCRSLLESVNSDGLLQGITRERLIQSNEASERANALMVEDVRKCSGSC